MTPQSITAANRPIRSVTSRVPGPADVQKRRRVAIRQAILRSTLIGVLAILIVLSIPLIRVLQTALWITTTRGCTVEWNVSSSNWWYGGNSAVTASPRHWGVRISDEDLRMLQHLPSVMTLSLPEDEKITDTGLLALRDLPSLTDLNLARLSRFRYEAFDTPALTDACLAFFEPLQKLESLTLSGNTITDAGLARIAKLPALRTLGLDATEITDAGLVYFGNMKNLETLDLGATRVTPAAVAKLRAARPDLIIILEADPEIEAGVKRARGAKR